MMSGEDHEGPLKVGERVLEKYEVRGLLGRGGQAFVYDCYDVFLEEAVAIKIIPSPEGRDLFRRAQGEAKLLYRLEHPNIVRVMNAGTIGDRMVYIVMERLDGMPLVDMMAALGRLTVVEALLIAEQIAKGVTAAHALGVIHRDLKPHNVFVLPGCKVKVLDFGIAKFLGPGMETTNKDVFHGTLLYMAPEHLQGLGVTVRSDVYALGLMLFEMLAGVHPIMIGAGEVNFQALAWRQISVVTPPIEEHAEGVPDDVAWLIRRSTAKSADQRFASMQEFLQAIGEPLSRLLRTLPREGRRVRTPMTAEETERARKHAAAGAEAEPIAVTLAKAGGGARSPAPVPQQEPALRTQASEPTIGVNALPEAAPARPPTEGVTDRSFSRTVSGVHSEPAPSSAPSSEPEQGRSPFWPFALAFGATLAAVGLGWFFIASLQGVSERAPASAAQEHTVGSLASAEPRGPTAPGAASDDPETPEVALAEQPAEPTRSAAAPAPAPPARQPAAARKKRAKPASPSAGESSIYYDSDDYPLSETPPAKEARSPFITDWAFPDEDTAPSKDATKAGRAPAPRASSTSKPIDITTPLF
ncbi:MAG TPA: protein kinase [Polyangiaceae bacterium]